MAVCWVVAPCDWCNFTDVSEVCTACIVRVMSHGATTQKTAIFRTNFVSSKVPEKGAPICYRAFDLVIRKKGMEARKYLLACLGLNCSV
jgi:hypothetical protein